MEDNQLNNFILRLQRLEDKLQHGEITNRGIRESNEELHDAIKELRDIYNSLDKRLSIHEEKARHLTYQITKLEETINALESVNEKESDHKRDIVENIFMAVLGGIITYLFSMLKS